jgi:hypothetical protein
VTLAGGSDKVSSDSGTGEGSRGLRACRESSGVVCEDERSRVWSEGLCDDGDDDSSELMLSWDDSNVLGKGTDMTMSFSLPSTSCDESWFSTRVKRS